MCTRRTRNLPGPQQIREGATSGEGVDWDVRGLWKIVRFGYLECDTYKKDQMKPVMDQWEK